MTSVVIPETVISIGEYAFFIYSGLKSVIIPESVSSIGNYAFYGCSSLTSVIIPNSVTSIGDYAFYGCIGLTSVILSESLEEIGIYAFAQCNAINVVEYPSTNPIKALGSIFTLDVYDYATLYVPEGTTNTYKETVPWSYFYNIEEKYFGILSISFKQSNYKVEIGESLDLNNEIVIMPEDATDKTLTWESSDTSVATVNNGIVTVIAEGTCEITATTTDGSNLSAVCNLNVLTGIESDLTTDELCDVYNMNGVLIKPNVLLKELKLAPGIYIVRQGSVTKKISVK